MSDCKDCGHLMSLHIGIVDMGGGHSEPLGCTEVMGKNNEFCDCMRYARSYEEGESDV